MVFVIAAAVILIRASRSAPGEGFIPAARAAAAEYLTVEYVTLTFRRVASILAVFYFFVHIKNLIPLVNLASFDRLYWDVDRIIHFGWQPNVGLMLALGDIHSITVTVDWLYIKFFSYMMVASLVFLSEAGGRKLAERYVFAFCLLWAAGGIAYFAAPADGPCYAALRDHAVPPEDRAHLIAQPLIKDAPVEYARAYDRSKIWIAKAYQERLWKSRKAFLIDGRQPGVFYGIAAMPSLHVAAVALIASFLWPVSRWLGVVGYAYLAVMLFGSALLQWHYLVDGYAGLALAWAVWVMSRYGTGHAALAYGGDGGRP